MGLQKRLSSKLGAQLMRTKFQLKVNLDTGPALDDENWGFIVHSDIDWAGDFENWINETRFII
jgi:hypothetical protein